MPRSPIPRAPKRQVPEPEPNNNFQEFSEPPMPRPVQEPKHHPQEPRLPEPVPGVSGKGPPLFIKIDKYKEVVNQIHSLKSYALNLRDALDALADIEKELQHGISITHRALDKFNTTISIIDQKITRSSPDIIEPPKHKEGEMEGYVHELHEQMEKIRNDLKNAMD